MADHQPNSNAENYPPTVWFTLLNDYASFAQWVRLEADPSVTSFCEHPARVAADTDAGLIDFWVQHAGLEELLVVDRGRMPTELPATLEGVDLKIVPAGELTAAATSIANWLRMIPVINATRGGA